jgi:heme A synthase
VTPAFRYLAGVSLVVAAAAVVLLAVPEGDRAPVGWGALIGLVLQAPLGWWTLRSLGAERFTFVWGLGMLARFAAVGIAALAALPLLGSRAAPMLLAMVGVLVALLLVEGVTAVREHSREDEQLRLAAACWRSWVSSSV